MTYVDLVTRYPWVDLMLEMFSKIVPVVVAVLAIIVNNTNSSKRDKRNKKIDMIVSYENMLVDKISALEDALDDLLDLFYEVLKCRCDKRIEIVYEKYRLAKGNVLKCNIELFNLTFCASEILKENVDSKDIMEDIKSIVKSMENMIENHMVDGILNGLDEDWVKDAKQIKNEVIEVKSWLSVDIKRVMEKTFNMLK